MILLTLLLAAQPAPALLPLTEPQMNRITDYGCNFGFTRGARTMIYAVNTRMLIRTAAGVRECSPTDAAFDAFTQGAGTLSCGDLALTLRRAGRVTAHVEADSATFPAELTIRRGDKRSTMKGTAGTAC